MVTNKKTKKRPTKSKSTGKKVTPTKELDKEKSTPKKLAKKSAPKKTAEKRKAADKKTTSKNTARAGKKQTGAKSRRVGTAVFSRGESGSRSGEQSGDLQGLSNVEAANSESVSELIEEGNTFEAEAVTGVEEAGDRGEKEVRTHEVPEDDVPGEYLDED
jgi:N utilization substance protein A